MVSCGCLLASVGIATAADPPPEASRPSPVVPGTLRSHIQPVGDVAVAGKHLPAAGLVTARAPDIVREQLALPRGRGLVVMGVAPDSLASRAGVRRHDVLVAVDGQWLLLPEQLEALIDTAAPEAALECQLIRGGKPLSVSLSGRPLPEASIAARAPSPAIGPEQRPGVAAGGPQALPPPAVTPAATTESNRAVASAGGDATTAAPSVVVPANGSGPLVAEAAGDGVGDPTLVQTDADYTLKLTPGAGLRLVVQDRRGRVVFNGPIDTPAQRARMPLAVRTRVEALERKITERDYRPPQPPTKVASRSATAGDRATPASVAAPKPAASSPAQPTARSPAQPAASSPAQPAATPADPPTLEVEPIEIR
jgi:hypothetical protein